MNHWFWGWIGYESERSFKVSVKPIVYPWCQDLAEKGGFVVKGVQGRHLAFCPIWMRNFHVSGKKAMLV